MDEDVELQYDEHQNYSYLEFPKLGNLYRQFPHGFGKLLNPDNEHVLLYQQFDLSYVCRLKKHNHGLQKLKAHDLNVLVYNQYRLIHQQLLRDKEQY